MSFCPNCGHEIAQDARFCPNCGQAVGTAGPQAAASPATVAPATAASASVAPATAAAAMPQAAGETHYIGLGLRFVAHLVDLVIVFVMFWIIGSNIAERTGGVTDAGFQLEGGPALAAMLLTLVAAILYFTLTEAMLGGQTLGKKLVRIKVVGEDGTPCTFTQALVRNIVRLVDAFALYLVGIILVATSPKKQRLGDRIAHTVVVKKVKGAKAPKAKAGEGKAKVRFSWGTRGNSDYVDL